MTDIIFNRAFLKDKAPLTATHLKFYSNNMNIYEGPKEDDG
jgi:hypothetical protein